MEDQKNYWKDNRYICLVRQSNDEDGDDSVKAQLSYLRTECDADSMIYVDKIELEGVTGSLPARREHFTNLKKRKLEYDDFDTIAIQRVDRATRSGGDFGIWLETELKLCGIRVRYVGEDLPTGRHSSLIKMIKYESAKDTAMSTSQRTTQGQSYAIEKGTLKTTGPTPYAAWRIYFTKDMKPAHIIRDCGNGLQERLHPETLALLDTHGTLGKKSYGRYKKQKNEIAFLRPGDPDEIRIVRIIFFLWFRWGWKGKRIASLLNKRSVPSPRALEWSQRQVESVLENEAYTGVTINGETHSGIYNKRKKGKGFEALNRDELELLTRETMPRIVNPMDDWDFVDQPLMAEFLPPHIRRMAIAYHERLWKQRTDPVRLNKPKKKNKHPNSNYLLSNFLVAKQDGETLTGTLCGRKQGPKTPYYRHRKGRRGYQKGSVFNNLIPMNPLHQELVRFLGSCLSNLPDLRRRLTEIIEEQRRYSESNDTNLEALVSERNEIRERVLWISRQSTKPREDAASEFVRLEARRDELDALTAQHRADARPVKEPTDRIVDRAIARCQRLADELPKLPSATMRELLVGLFFSRVEVDMETKAVTASVALPSFVLEAWKRAGIKDIDQNDLVSMCLGSNSRSPIYSDTHRTSSPIFEGICRYVHPHGSHDPVCYECRRKAA
jgi:hypothetical protein